MSNEPVNLVLSHDEALVLMGLLVRYDETEQLTVSGPAEQLALWRLEATLEKNLLVIFSADYAEQLRLARERLFQENGGS